MEADQAWIERVEDPDEDARAGDQMGMGERRTDKSRMVRPRMAKAVVSCQQWPSTVRPTGPNAAHPQLQQRKPDGSVLQNGCTTENGD